MEITDAMIKKAATEADRAILAQIKEEPAECFVISEAHRNKMDALLAKARGENQTCRPLRRIACITVSFLVFLIVCISSNTQVQAQFTGWAKEQIRGMQYWFYVGPADQSLQKYELGWIPEGYDLEKTFQLESGCAKVYYDPSGKILQFTYLHGTSSTVMYTDNVDYSQKKISFDGKQGILYISPTPYESNCFIWNDAEGTTIFTISTFLGEEDILKLAKSVH